MKRVTFALCLLSIIPCLGLLQSCHKDKEKNKPLLYGYTTDGKVLTDNSACPNHICIYFSDGKKIERTCCYNGKYSTCYLTSANSDSEKEHYEMCEYPTDKLMIKFFNKNWNSTDGKSSYNDDLYEYLWLLRDELNDNGIHIMDWNLVHRYKKQWNSSNGIWMELHTYSPLIENGSFKEVINDPHERGFSIDPNDIEKVELWSDPSSPE